MSLFEIVLLLEILMMLVVGMRTMLGPILSAFIIVTLENKVGDIGASSDV